MNPVSNFINHIHGLLLGAKKSYGAVDFIFRMLVMALALSVAFWLFTENTVQLQDRAIFASVIFFAFILLSYLWLFLAAKTRMDALEEALPEFLSVMASHIRSGQTYDRALLLSSRKEFGPLAEEIDEVGMEAMTGTPLSEALSNLARRTPSQQFSSTINLVVKGLNSGGKLAELLESTSLDIRRFSSIRKEVSATVLVYQLFSIAAACFGAPLLYAITVFLVKVFAQVRGKVGLEQVAGSQAQMPFFQSAPISPEQTFLFAVAALFITCLFGAFATGVIAKGKESEGLPYLPIMLVVAFGVFFLTSFLLENFLSSFFF